jgi:hypothetical protein
MTVTVTGRQEEEIRSAPRGGSVYDSVYLLVHFNCSCGDTLDPCCPHIGRIAMMGENLKSGSYPWWEPIGGTFLGQFYEQSKYLASNHDHALYCA